MKMEELKMYDKVSANRNVIESEKAVEKFWKARVTVSQIRESI